MKIIPIASDSLGIRSMATYIQTRDCNILIDPGAAIAEKRYGLFAHKKEKEKLEEIQKKLKKISEKCGILTISHYHFDHFSQNKDIYKNKTVFAKDINSYINKSQKQRGEELKQKIQDSCKLIYGDNSKHIFGNTEIFFSKPFYHGPEKTRLGFVIMTTVKDKDKTIIHSSDVQGPVNIDATKYIIEKKPDLIILDGPPTFLLGFRFSYKNLEKASNNLVKIIKNTNSEIILDHHLLRDLRYKEIFSKPYAMGRKRIKTFAEYLGNENNTLEANRKKLWGK